MSNQFRRDLSPEGHRFSHDVLAIAQQSIPSHIQGRARTSHASARNSRVADAIQQEYYGDARITSAISTDIWLIACDLTSYFHPEDADY